MLTTKVIAKTTVANMYFWVPKRLPPIVEVTTDGNLAMLAIMTNLRFLIFVSPEIYVSKSLGVPGKRNIK